jgi:hypothetical protein
MQGKIYLKELFLKYPRPESAGEPPETVNTHEKNIFKK